MVRYSFHGNEKISGMLPKTYLQKQYRKPEVYTVKDLQQSPSYG